MKIAWNKYGSSQGDEQGFNPVLLHQIPGFAYSKI